MNDFEGMIIEESLADKGVLDEVVIVDRKIEQATVRHETPWVDQWTLDTVRISENEARQVADWLSRAIDTSHKTAWYADFKNNTHHYIIYPNRVFFIQRNDKSQYQEATDYGISLGIPDYQVDFSPHIKLWDR